MNPIKTFASCASTGISGALLLSAVTMGSTFAADSAGSDSLVDGSFYVFADQLSDSSNVELENDLGKASLDDKKWDDHARFGIGFATQSLMSDKGGLLFTTGVELGYNLYRSEDGSSELKGEALMLSPRLGLGIHAAEWLFVEGQVFGGVGAAQFTYKDDANGIDSKSDYDFATEYGAQVNAYIAVSESLILGARAGWMAQKMKGDFDGPAVTGDTDFTSSTEGMFYGLMVGFRY